MQERETGLIPGLLDVGESMILRIYLGRGIMMEVLNRGLDMAVIEENN